MFWGKTKIKHKKFSVFELSINYTLKIQIMKSFTQHLVQWVWSTKMRKPTLHPEGQEALYAYIAGLLKNKKCRPFAINGTEDHLHIVSSLHPSLNVSGFIKDIKLSTSDYLSRSGILPDFEGWQDGYGSFTYAKSALQNLTCFIHKSRITQVANICFAPPSRSPALKGGDGGAFVMQLTEKKLKIRLPLGSGKCGFSVLEGRGKESAEEKDCEF
jgi:putative transposase